MENHYHLFIETPEGNLVDVMKWLQNTYARRFNIRFASGTEFLRSLQSAAGGPREGFSLAKFALEAHTSAIFHGEIAQRSICLPDLPSMFDFRARFCHSAPIGNAHFRLQTLGQCLGGPKAISYQFNVRWVSPF
jgi:hypothetical protein